ncbi:MAG: hypothetical protein EU543_03060 [Promethearchaeota archaeon]|nr:MAG: hypothetical protein EU543_03060 [Candidatus Lokiarchaeota archaeon]
MKGKSKIVVKVPHRITGFFEIVDSKNGIKLENPEQIGSRGAGFTLNAMGTTTIILNKIISADTNFKECEIYINSIKVNEEAETTNFIFNYFRRLVNYPFSVKIFHRFDLPVGCGYGASGSGALGTSFGLNKLLKLNLSNYECGKIAHIAEVVNKTGLGTVCGQLAAGLGMVAESGYPGKYQHIPFPNGIYVICTSFGKISTPDFLSNQTLHSIVNIPGRDALRKLKKNPNIKNFAELSWEFVQKTEILEILHLSKIRELIVQLNELNIIGASLNQLGKSIFAICRKRDIKDVITIFNNYQEVDKVFNLHIEKKGVKIN